MPVLAEVMPHYRQTLARSARHAAQAQGLLEELAQDDLKRTGSPPQIAALQSPLVGKILGSRKGWAIDPARVKRVTAKVAGLTVYDGAISDGAQSMLDLIGKHGRAATFTFHMLDGSKQRWRGNGHRVA
jgi:hypothetical protein